MWSLGELHIGASRVMLKSGEPDWFAGQNLLQNRISAMAAMPATGRRYDVDEIHPADDAAGAR